MFNFKDILENEECRWFLRWLDLRRKNKQLSFKNGQLESEVAHLNHVISIYKKDEEFRVIKALKAKEREQRKLKRIAKKKYLKQKQNEYRNERHD